MFESHCIGHREGPQRWLLWALSWGSAQHQPLDLPLKYRGLSLLTDTAVTGAQAAVRLRGEEVLIPLSCVRTEVSGPHPSLENEGFGL